MFMLMGLLTGLFAAFAPTASAVSVPGDPTGSITGFEIEGNQTSDGQGLDWQALVGSDTLTVVSDDPSGNTDSGLQGSSKENDPSGWTCDTGGSNPPKNNILHAAINDRFSPTGAFLDLAYVREGQTGNAHVNFEFNQEPITGNCPLVGRTTGDLLLLFNFPGGAGQADVAAFFWDSTISADGEWVNAGTIAAAAATNSGTVADFIFPDIASMENRQFGEASLDLIGIFGSDPDTCVSFGTLNVRSRSSAGNLEEDSNSINSALQDRLAPTPIDLSTCGTVTLNKTDDTDAPLAGATFGLFESEADAEAETNAIDTCITDNDGACTFDEVIPGTYYVTEISAPAGYEEDETVIEVELEALGEVELEYTFVDPRKTGDVTVEKDLEDADGNPIDLTAGNIDHYDDYLVGAQFDLQQGGSTADDANGDPLTCTITLADIDLTTDSATCEFDDVLYGDYVVHETPPAGTSPEVNDQAITVDDAHVSVTVSFTNVITPDAVVLKATTTPSVTAGGTVSFDLTVSNNGAAPAVDVVLTDTLNGTVTGWSSDPGDPPCTIAANVLTCDIGTLDPGEDFDVTVTGTTTTGSCPSFTNQASVSSSNESEADAANNNSAVVTVNVTCPTPPPPPPPPPPAPIDISIVKDGPALAHRGDEITYTFTVTNTGDVALVTVVLTDPICDDGTIALVDDGNGDTTLAVDEVWTYECTRVITDTDPDPLPNTATVLGTDVQGRTTDDADDHEVDLIEPAIQVVKTVDDESPSEGQTVTFTYVVTNTGDTTLFDVEVVDDLLGAIGTIDELEPGASATLTKTMVVAAGGPTVNVATATGADVLGKSVTDADDATITIVLGEVIARPVELPRTGADTESLILLSAVLLLVGGLLVTSGSGVQLVARRRQP
jgi:uncharacterized repeat protein (TIGR01451 family)